MNCGNWWMAAHLLYILIQAGKIDPIQATDTHTDLETALIHYAETLIPYEGSCFFTSLM